MWADWYGFKMEAYDAVKENIPLVHNAGACAIVHSDDPNGIQRLNQEAAKALADGRRAGINISDEVAWEWLSRNPAKALGILDKTGTLAPGKMADVVLWNGNPFSDYTRPERVWIDGADDVRRQRSEAAAGQRLRARPARRRRREMIRALIALPCSSQPPRPRRAQTFAISGGTVALGDGSEPIPNGMVVDPRRPDRRGRRRAHEAARRNAGDRRHRQMGDAGHRRRLLAPWPCRSRPSRAERRRRRLGAPTTPRRTGRSTLPSTWFRRSIRSTPPIAVNRADGVTRAIVAPNAGKNIFAGQGAVIDTGADMDPITRGADVPVRRAWRRPARTRQAARARRLTSCSATPCAKRRSCAAMRRRSRRRRRQPDERERPVVHNPNESRLYGPTPAQRRRAADPLRRGRARAGAARTAVSARPRRARAATSSMCSTSSANSRR